MRESLFRLILSMRIITPVDCFVTQPGNTESKQAKYKQSAHYAASCFTEKEPCALAAPLPR